MINIDYSKKYIKYKEKYLKLKFGRKDTSQFGGTSIGKSDESKILKNLLIDLGDTDFTTKLNEVTKNCTGFKNILINCWTEYKKAFESYLDENNIKLSLAEYNAPLYISGDVTGLTAEEEGLMNKFPPPSPIPELLLKIQAYIRLIDYQ